jgi:hypothetical protein
MSKTKMKKTSEKELAARVAAQKAEEIARQAGCEVAQQDYIYHKIWYDVTGYSRPEWAE